MQISHNNDRPNGTNKLVWYLFSTAMAVIILGGSAWASYVNHTIWSVQKDVSELKTQYQVILTKLDTLIDEIHARHK